MSLKLLLLKINKYTRLSLLINLFIFNAWRCACVCVHVRVCVMSLRQHLIYVPDCRCVTMITPNGCHYGKWPDYCNSVWKTYRRLNKPALNETPLRLTLWLLHKRLSHTAQGIITFFFFFFLLLLPWVNLKALCCQDWFLSLNSSSLGCVWVISSNTGVTSPHDVRLVGYTVKWCIDRNPEHEVNSTGQYSMTFIRVRDQAIAYCTAFV